jgi:TRAP transporter TAXI family solute receptor
MDIRFAVNSVPGARLVALDNISELLERHGYYSISTIPIGLYPGLANEGDVETVGLKTLFLTSAEVPDDVVYTLTGAVFEDIESLGEYDEVLKGLTSESMIQGSSAPLHPGAARYYEEVGLRPPR